MILDLPPMSGRDELFDPVPHEVTASVKTLVFLLVDVSKLVGVDS